MIVLSGFKIDCPSGKLKKDKALEIYTVLIPNGDANDFVDNIFRIFDKDKNGSIDFNVRYTMLNLLLPTKAIDKLKVNRHRFVHRSFLLPQI